MVSTARTWKGNMKYRKLILHSNYTFHSVLSLQHPTMLETNFDWVVCEHCNICVIPKEVQHYPSCPFGSVWQDPSKPQRPNMCFDLWNAVRLLIQCKVPCNNHGLFIHNDYVLNKCTFYLSQASAPLAFPPSDHTCILYIELFIIKRLYINISINILYVQMRGRQISIFLPMKLSQNMFLNWKFLKQMGKISRHKLQYPEMVWCC